MTSKAVTKQAAKPALDAAPLPSVTGSKNEELSGQLLQQLRNTLWLPEALPEEERRNRFKAAVALMAAIKPSDAIEGMLGVQMVGVHSAAMECLRRAQLPGQTPKGRDQNLLQAQRLLGLYTRQLDTLNKHRGKGQQKVTVEHVHVAPGGQAIVGHVSAGDNKSKSPTATPALTHSPPAPLETKPNEAQLHNPVRVRRRVR